VGLFDRGPAAVGVNPRLMLLLALVTIDGVGGNQHGKHSEDHQQHSLSVAALQSVQGPPGDMQSLL
jgi:hypothetical protein